MRVAVIGVGLIGGSIAAAARERLGAEVWGVDRDPRTLQVALARGLIDRACESGEEALSGSQAAFVAVPVGALQATAASVLAAAPAGCVVTDVGSIKRAIVGALQDPRFVGGHPLAGTERSGAGHARADLFDGATWYLTPSPATAPERYEFLCALIRRLGARPVRIDAGDHDRLAATVSHLPHVLANVLVCQAESVVNAVRHPAPVGGPSFRDATRVAGAPSTMWGDIYAANADLLADAIGRAVASLEEFRGALVAGDGAAIAATCEDAATARARLEGESQ